MLTERAAGLITAIGMNMESLGRRPLVSIDIDAVTQETSAKALNYVSHRFKRVVLKEHLKTYWELAKIARANGIRNEDPIEFAKKAWNRNEVYLESPVVPGITTLLEIFRDLGIAYIFPSSRPPEFLETSREWYQKTFPWVRPEDIILGRQEGVSGGDFKAEVIKQEGALLHLEDAVEEAVIIAEKTNAKIIIVPQPWNVEEHLDVPNIKQLGPYVENAGVWPVVKFLASSEARRFLSVAQS